jgi:hypothetical protein
MSPKATWRVWVAPFAVLAACAVTAPGASAAVTVGSTLQIDPNDSGTGEQSYVQTSLPAGGGVVTSPIDGVITRWRVRGFTQGATPAQILFRVMRPAGAGAFTAVSSTSAQLPIALGTYDFPARDAIQAGDYIGLTQTPGNTIVVDCDGCPGVGAFEFFAGPFTDGQTRASTPTADELLTINAEVEPSPTGQRAAALKKCKTRAHKHHWSKKRLRKCKKKARLLPL